MEKLKFDISGMTCSSCASHVNRAVSKLKGVKNVNVNLLLNNMEVEFDNKILKSDDIIQAVEKAGYGASLDGNKKESNTKKEKIIKIKRPFEYKTNIVSKEMEDD